MSGRGVCYDNAACESFFHTLKVELIKGEDLANFNSTRKNIFEYIETYYNRVRLHSTLGYNTPSEFEAKAEVDHRASAPKHAGWRGEKRDLAIEVV